MNSDDFERAFDERRFVIVPVDPAAIIHLFRSLGSRAGSVCIPQFKGLPPGYFVDSVHNNYQSRCLDFLVYHVAFEPVADGSMGPTFTDYEVEVVAYRREEALKAARMVQEIGGMLDSEQLQQEPGLKSWRDDKPLL